ERTLKKESWPHPEKETIFLNLKKPIRRLGSGFWVGAGIGRDIELVGLNFRMEAEANYKHGFNNIVKGNRRYENKTLIFGYYDVFDDIKARHFEISVKVLVSMYRKTFRR
ncbi:MAG: hypothetical protein GY950_34265, partial [bacterium]|nr:hypothetical protein [bacterium]